MKIFLVDELIGNLDEINGGVIMDLLFLLCDWYGVILIMVIYVFDFVVCCDCVICLCDGCVEDGV